MIKVTLTAQYDSLYKMLKMTPVMIRTRRLKLIDKPFFERIMLAVTEVNGCDVCSYAHTKIALETGMSTTEIRSILGGELKNVPDYELTALLFAQHYAESGGKPSWIPWQKLTEEYGKEKATAILAIIRTIMFGNLYGIPLSRIIRRLKGERGICIPVEILRELTILPFLPFAIISNVLDCILGKPVLTSEK